MRGAIYTFGVTEREPRAGLDRDEPADLAARARALAAAPDDVDVLDDCEDVVPSEPLRPMRELGDQA